MQYVLILFEALLLAVLLVLALIHSRAIIRITQPFASAFRWFSRLRVACIVLCAALPLVIRLAILPSLGMRAPKTHDEFAQLLQAETFAQGRLTTPSPVLPHHFESVHVSVTPSYFSKYPPAKAAMLALGQRLWGHPWWGAWLSVGLMCAAVCWMLQRWLPPGWALLGGLLVAARLGIFSYWMNSYWGGAIPAAAGALVLGAARGVLRADRERPPPVSDVLLMVIGAVVLANSRPFEGLILCGAVGLLVLIALFRARIALRVVALRVALPALLVLVPAAAVMGRYHAALTGSPTLLPYELNSAQYRMGGQFIWSPPKPERAYRHGHLVRFYARESETQLSKRSITAMPRHLGALVTKSWLFYIAPALTLALFAAPRLLRGRRTRPLLLSAAAVGAGLAANAFFIPHYAAPILAAMVALLVQGLRYLRQWHWRGSPVGMALVRGIPAVILLTVTARFALPPRVTAALSEYPLTWFWTDPGGTERAWILETFEERPRRHLLLVDYDESASHHSEWVYNGAEIRTQHVVWARSLSPEQNAELIRHFPDRTPWLMVISGKGNEIWPYYPNEKEAEPQRQGAPVMAQRAAP